MREQKMREQEMREQEMREQGFEDRSTRGLCFLCLCHVPYVISYFALLLSYFFYPGSWPWRGTAKAATAARASSAATLRLATASGEKGMGSEAK